MKTIQLFNHRIYSYGFFVCYFWLLRANDDDMLRRHRQRLYRYEMSKHKCWKCNCLWTTNKKKCSRCTIDVTKIIHIFLHYSATLTCLYDFFLFVASKSCGFSEWKKNKKNHVQTTPFVKVHIQTHNRYDHPKKLSFFSHSLELYTIRIDVGKVYANTCRKVIFK